MLKILVVCTANICRSPAFQVFLRRALLHKNVRIDSAGVHAIDGNLADPVIKELLAERGFPEITDHRSRGLLASHLNFYDLVLCMELAHKTQILSINPTVIGKVMVLRHWDGGGDVEDPTGQPRDAYVIALREMEHLCAFWVNKLTTIGLIE